MFLNDNGEKLYLTNEMYEAAKDEHIERLVFKCEQYFERMRGHELEDCEYTPHSYAIRIREILGTSNEYDDIHF